MGSDKASGIACLGGGDYTPFKIERQQIALNADWPKITDVTLAPGKSAQANTYRPDESIGYSVLGNVNNLDPKNADKRCGWTVLLEGNGQSVELGNGTFFNMQMTASLAAFKPGSYTLKAHSTTGNDALAKMDCLGSASKPITIAAIPGQIKGLKLEAWGIHGKGSDIENALNTAPAELLFPPSLIIDAFTPDNGVLRITPIIEGPKCSYHITQLINGGAAPQQSGPRVHVPGVSDRQPIQIYAPDQTNVQVTLEVGPMEKAMGNPCEGTISKSITVHDDPKLPLVTR